jgi:crotonobetainyl-CoA:carnitine CoA-transferase CaiB-like acyl-CoA transferase
VDHEQMGTAPGHRLYRLADGWIALCATSEGALATTCSVLGAQGPGCLEACFSEATSDIVSDALKEAGVDCEVVRLDQGESFLDDPLARSLDLVASYPHAEWGVLEQVGAFWSLGDLEVSLRRAPPLLGQHSIEVLVEAGMDPDAIEALVAQGVLVQAGP